MLFNMFYKKVWCSHLLYLSLGTKIIPMEYRAKNITALLEFVKSATPEEGAAFLQKYGDIREERGIVSGWEKCTQLHRKCRHLKQMAQRSFVMNDDNGFVELHELNKLMFFILDELGRIGNDDIADAVMAKVSGVKIDRRLTFQQ